MDGDVNLGHLNIPSTESLRDMFQINKTTGFSYDINTFYFQAAQNFINHKDATDDQKQEWSAKLSFSYRDYILGKMKEKVKSRVNRVTGKEIKGSLADYKGQEKEILHQIISFISPEKEIEFFERDTQELLRLCLEGDTGKIKDKISQMQKRYLGKNISGVVGDIIG